MINTILSNKQSKEQGYVSSLIRIGPLLKFIQKCENIDKSEIHNYNFVLFHYHYVPPYITTQRNVTLIGDTNMILHDYVVTKECKDFILQNFTNTSLLEFSVYDRRPWVNTSNGIMQKSPCIRELVLNFRYEPEIHGFFEAAKLSRNVGTSSYNDELDDIRY
jgi:hypothetical protein